jgi:hemolysin III
MGNTKLTALKLTEEVFNSSIHGLGALAAVAGLVFGLLNNSWSGTSRIGFVVYAASLVLLMTMSSLYHAFFFSKAKRVFQVLDHSAIFVLIAGSYTPFILYLFNGWQMYLMIVAVWGIATAGIVLEAVLPNLAKRIGVGLYIGFGWLAVFLVPYLSLLNWSVERLLIIGGLIYTVGAVIMAFKKPFTHVGWHLMVLVAASTHYAAIIKLS